jgi:hypothetical protein
LKVICGHYEYNSRDLIFFQEIDKSLVTRLHLIISDHDVLFMVAYQGNFHELLQFLAKHNKEIDKVILENILENHQMIALDI